MKVMLNLNNEFDKVEKIKFKKSFYLVDIINNFFWNKMLTSFIQEPFIIL